MLYKNIIYVSVCMFLCVRMRAECSLIDEIIRKAAVIKIKLNKIFIKVLHLYSEYHVIRCISRHFVFLSIHNLNKILVLNEILFDKNYILVSWCYRMHIDLWQSH